MNKFLRYWGPPLVWMSIIFFFSSRESVAVSNVYTWNFVFFKTLHMIEYAGLYFLLFRAILQSDKSNDLKKRALTAAFVLAFLYAVSDEIHQTYVPTREGTFRDVGIDVIGMFLMYSYSKYRFKSISRFL